MSRRESAFNPGKQVQGVLVPRLEKIRAQTIAKNLFIARGFSSALDEQQKTADVGAQAATLLERDLAYKPDISGEIPQYLRTILELTKEGGAGGVSGLSSSNFNILLNSLIQFQKATLQSVVENSVVAMGYDKNISPEMNKSNNFLMRVMGRFGETIQNNSKAVGFAMSSQTQANIKKAVDFITNDSETLSMQVKVIAMNNPALVDPRYMEQGVDGLARVKPGSPLMGSLVVGQDGSIRLAVHSSVFAQFAIDNDGDVVQLMVQKLKGKKLLESAYSAWFQKSPNLRHQGGLRLMNLDLNEALAKASSTDDEVVDALTGRHIRRNHAEASLDQEKFVDMVFSGKQHGIFNWLDSGVGNDDPYAVSLDDLGKLTNRINTVEKLRSNFTDAAVVIKDEFKTIDFEKMGAHSLYKEADLSALVSTILNPNNPYADERAKFLDQMTLLDSARLDPKKSVGAVSQAASDPTRLLANSWYKWQSTKTLPQIAGTANVGMLTNSTMMFELFQTIKELDSKINWTSIDLKNVEEISQLEALDPESFAAITGIGKKLAAGQNMTSHRFEILELMALKASASGRMATARDAWKGEAPRQLIKELIGIAFKADEDANKQGWESMSAVASILRGTYTTKLHDTFGELALNFTKALQKPGATLDDVFTVVKEHGVKVPGSSEEMLEQYEKAGKKYNIDYKRTVNSTGRKSLFDRMLDLGIYEFKKVNVDSETIGAGNEQFYKGTYVLVSRDAAGNTRSAGLQEGMLGANKSINGMVTREKVLETTFLNTVLGVDWMPGMDLSAAQLKALDPMELFRANMQHLVEDGVTVRVSNGRKKGEEEVFNFALGDFTGKGYSRSTVGEPGAAKKLKGISMDLFEGSNWSTTGQYIVRDAMEGLTDRGDTSNPMLRGFVGEDVSDNDLVNAAVKKVQKMIQDGDIIGAQRAITLGFSRRAGGVKDAKAMVEAIADFSEEIGHTGEVLLTEGSSRARIAQEAGLAAHGRSVTLVNYNGPMSDHNEAIMLAAAAVSRGVSLENAFKSTSRAIGGTRTWFSPNPNDSNSYLGVPEKRFSKSSGQVVKSVETKSRLMYFSNNVFANDMTDEVFSKAFTGQDQGEMFKTWNKFFFDPDGWEKEGINTNNEKGQGQASTISFLGQQEKMREKTKNWEDFQEYAPRDKPTIGDRKSGKAVYKDGKWYKRITSEDLSSDAKIITEAGDIKIVPVSSGKRAIVSLDQSFTVGEKEITSLEADLAVNMGEARAKLDHPFAILFKHGIASGLDQGQVISKLKKGYEKIRRTGSEEERRRAWDEVLEEFGLVRGTFSRDGVTNSQVLISKEANVSINPIINPAEHMASKIDSEGNFIQGNVAQMKTGGNLTDAESRRKLAGQGSASALGYVYERGGGNGGPEVLINEIIKTNPGMSREDAMRALENAFNDVADVELSETAKNQVGELQEQFKNIMNLNIAIFEQMTGANMGTVEKQQELLSIRETKKLAQQHGNLLGGDQASKILMGRLTMAEADLDQSPNNMFNMLKELTPTQKSSAIAGATLAASAALLSRSRHEAKKGRARDR